MNMGGAGVEPPKDLTLDTCMQAPCNSTGGKGCGSVVSAPAVHAEGPMFNAKVELGETSASQ